MPYLVDRQRALRTTDIVAVVAGQRRRLRSCVVLRDNSLYQTLTRPQTLMRYAGAYPAAIVRIGLGRKPKEPNSRSRGAAWRKQP